MKVEQHAVVSIHYTLTDDADVVLDSSSGSEPLTYLHGIGALIPGLENELLGKVVGDKLSVKVPPALGYGELDEALIQAIPLEALDGIENIEPGMQLRTSEEDDSPGRIITVTEIADGLVTIDSNHPLAGVTLNFEVEVVAVRQATSEEVSHGHIH